MYPPNRHQMLICVTGGADIALDQVATL